MMTEKITRDEYVCLRDTHRAGPDLDWVTPEMADVWKLQGWHGKHWKMYPGPALGPVNVEGGES